MVLVSFRSRKTFLGSLYLYGCVSFEGTLSNVARKGSQRKTTVTLDFPAHPPPEQRRKATMLVLGVILSCFPLTGKCPGQKSATRLCVICVSSTSMCGGQLRRFQGDPNDPRKARPDALAPDRTLASGLVTEVSECSVAF